MQEKKILDEFIKKKINTEYVNFAVKSPIYQKYTTRFDYDDDLKVVQKNILEHVEKRRRFDARKIDLDEFIKKKIDAEYVDFAVKSPIYQKYTTKFDYEGDLKMIQKNILELVEKKICFDARKADLDEFIQENFDIEHIYFLTHLPIYQKYTTNMNYNVRIEYVQKKLSEQVASKVFLADRKKNLDKLIQKKFDNKFKDYLSKLPIYKKYITDIDCDVELDKIHKIMSEYVEKKIRLDKFIKKHAKDEYVEFMQESDIYLKYTTKLKEEIDFALISEMIKDLANKESVQHARRDKISRKCGNWLHSVKENNKIYDAYVCNGGDVDVAIRKIKEHIIDLNNQKTQNIDGSIHSIGFKDVDSKYYDDVKFDYLVGRIKLFQATETLKDIKKNINN